MDDKTLNVPDWWPDEPIPVYYSKEPEITGRANIDWTKLNEAIDPMWHDIDEPLPGYYSQKDPTAKQIYITTAGIHNNIYSLLAQYEAKRLLEQTAEENKNVTK